MRNFDTVRVANEIFYRKDGTSFPVEYVARPQLDSTPDSSPRSPVNRAVGVVVAFRDTTDRRALDRMKDEFISTVSHELRTPLTSLARGAWTRRRRRPHQEPEKQQQMLEIAIGNTDRLIRLVNDFLDIETHLERQRGTALRSPAPPSCSSNGPPASNRLPRIRNIWSSPSRATRSTSMPIQTGSSRP